MLTIHSPLWRRKADLVLFRISSALKSVCIYALCIVHVARYKSILLKIESDMAH